MSDHLHANVPHYHPKVIVTCFPQTCSGHTPAIVPSCPGFEALFGHLRLMGAGVSFFIPLETTQRVLEKSTFGLGGRHLYQPADVTCASRRHNCAMKSEVCTNSGCFSLLAEHKHTSSLSRGSLANVATSWMTTSVLKGACFALRVWNVHACKARPT